MALVTPAQARAHVRVDAAYPEDQITPYIDGAVDTAQAYLNRTIYETAELLKGARDGYAASVADAAAARTAAIDAAGELTDEVEKAAAIRLAEVQYVEALAEADRCIHGIVVTPSIMSAILLILGHLFANRETVVVGATAVDMPVGAMALLRQYRRVMMP